MKRNLDWIQKWADEIIVNDDDRNKLFSGIEQIDRGEWDLPKAVADLGWVRKDVSTEGHDALKTGVNILATVEPHITMQPLSPGMDDKDTANNIEKALKWELKRADERRATPFIRDVTRSALRYNMVAVQVINMAHQSSALKTLGKEGPRSKYIMRGGSYTLKVHNPKAVHFRFSDYGLEQVLLHRKMKAIDVVDFWGIERTKGLWNDIKDKPDDVMVWLYDYESIEQRCVWCVSDDGQHKGGYVIVKPDEEKKVPFISWAIRRGGTDDLEEREKDKYHPMLESIWTTGKWDTQNIIDSLTLSEALKYALRPRGKKSGINPAAIDVSYAGDQTDVELGPQQEYDLLPERAIDRFLPEVSDRNRAAITKTTLAKILQSLDAPEGAAFATVNALIQAATASLEPYKVLSERTISDVCKLMLYWVDFRDEPLNAMDSADKTKSYGNHIQVKKGDFNVAHIYIDTKLTAQVPTDFMQRINAAVLMHERLDYPLERAYEDLNVGDPEDARNEWMQEQLDNNELQLAVQNRQVEEQMIQQQQMMEMQQAQQMQQAMMGQNPMQQTPESMGVTQGNPGFNPAMGGMPPATVSPNDTRERISGRDRRGNPVAEEAV